MINRPLTAALVASFALAGIGAARAQDAAPEAPKCGGLVCDMGLYTGKRDPAFGPEPTCGFFCKITGGQAEADARAAQEQQAAAAAAAPPEPAAEPKSHRKAKRKHVAKAAKAEAAADAKAN